MSVTIKNLQKTFTTSRGLVQAIRDLDLEIKDGEFFSLLGPSGCGKTTTIRCIAGLETPDDGEIWLGDQMVYSKARNKLVPAHQRKLGMVFQSYAIWPHMNVFDNIAFPMKHGSGGKYTKTEIEESVTRACKLVQLAGFEYRPSTQLSGGQQQRVALARCLVKDPNVVLLDEPLSNLDAKLRAETRVELRRLVKSIGATAVYVTHDQVEAFAVSDRIGVMLNGELIQVGTPQEIYLKPQHEFIADFVGRINFLDGTVVQDDNRQGEKVVETQIGRLASKDLEDIPAGNKVKIGVRAENIKILEKMPKDNENCFTGVVKSAVFLGEYISCEVEIGGQLIDINGPPEHHIVVGSEISVLLPRDLIVVIPCGDNVKCEIPEKIIRKSKEAHRK